MRKPTCEERRAIDIRTWAAEGRLEPGRQWLADVFKGEQVAGRIRVSNQENGVILAYGVPGKEVIEAVAFDWTAPNLGGRRPWFVCPGCQHRRAILYNRHRRFRCRTCHALVYASQRIGPSKRPPKGNQHGIGSGSDLTSEAEADERQSI